MPTTPNLSLVLIDEVNDDILPDVQIDPNTTKYDTILEALRNPPRGKMFKTGNQTIPNAVETVLSWQSTDYSNLVTADVGGGRFVILKNGTYHIGAQIRWEDGVAGTDRKAFLHKNGVTVAQAANSMDGAATLGAATNQILYDDQLVGGDVLEISVWHNNGSSLDVATNFGGTKFWLARFAFTGLGDT